MTCFGIAISFGKSRECWLLFFSTFTYICWLPRVTERWTKTMQYKSHLRKIENLAECGAGDYLYLVGAHQTKPLTIGLNTTDCSGPIQPSWTFYLSGK